MQRLFLFLSRINTSVFLSILYVAGIFSLAMTISLAPDAVGIWRYILWSLPFIFWGIAGIIMIIRREAYFFLRFEGILAVIFGFVLVFVSLFLATIPLLLVANDYFFP